MRRGRRLWIVLLAVPFLLLAADTLYWCDRRTAISRTALPPGWPSGGRPAGSVTAGKPVRGGWPLAATLTVPTVSLGAGTPYPGGWPGALTGWCCGCVVATGTAGPRGRRRSGCAWPASEVPYSATHRLGAAAAGGTVAELRRYLRGRPARRRRSASMPGPITAPAPGLHAGGAVRRAGADVHAGSRGDRSAGRRGARARSADREPGAGRRAERPVPAGARRRSGQRRGGTAAARWRSARWRSSGGRSTCRPARRWRWTSSCSRWARGARAWSGMPRRSMPWRRTPRSAGRPRPRPRQCCRCWPQPGRRRPAERRGAADAAVSHAVDAAGAAGAAAGAGLAVTALRPWMRSAAR